MSVWLAMLLQLGALFLGSMLISIVDSLLAGREELKLHEGTAILVTVVGAAFCWFWGWAAVMVMLGGLLAWTVIGGLVGRAKK